MAPTRCNPSLQIFANGTWTSLTLKFKPLNMDVLPLYIVLMAFFPVVLRAMLAKPNERSFARSAYMFLRASLAGICRLA